LQTAHNVEHGITPRGVIKSVDQVRLITRVADARTEADGGPPMATRDTPARRAGLADAAERAKLIVQLEEEMKTAAAALDFETAARLRDELFDLRAAGGDAQPAAAPGSSPGGARRRSRRSGGGGTPMVGGAGTVSGE
jgi:excinuclease ABC subunit B